MVKYLKVLGEYRRTTLLLLSNPYGRATPYNGSYYGRDPLLFTCLFEGASSY
jgi:hypothetical protein